MMKPVSPVFPALRGAFGPRARFGLAALFASLLVQACGPSPSASTNSSSDNGTGAAGGGGNGGSSTAGSGGGGGTVDTGGAGGTGASTGGTGGTGTSTGGAGGVGGGFDPEAGWTDFVASADTQKIYVSSSTGDDAKDGLTPDTAVKTIAVGVKLLRDGFPDWLLLRRGDTWKDQWLDRWKKSGKSPTEPMVVSYFGDMAAPRPRLNTGVKGALTAYDSPNTTVPVNYLAISGIHFYADKRDPASPTYDAAATGNEGVRWLTKTDGFLIEDVVLEFYTGNITVQGSANKPQTNVTIRRSIITDAYNIDPLHSEGIYAELVDGLLIEQNVFDHNGWNADVPKGLKTTFNHNMYIQADCKNVVVQDNISARASSHGAQVRPGGKANDNLFVQNPLAMSFGLVFGAHASTPGGVTGEIAGNVILEGNDIGDSPLLRGFGIQLGNIVTAEVHDNVFAHNKSSSSGSGSAIDFSDGNFGVGLDGLTVENNVIYDWHGGFQFDTSNKNGIDMMTYKNNAVQLPGTGYLAQYYAGSVSSGIHFSTNTYSSGSDPAKWFFVKPNAVSFDKWEMASGESGGEAAVVKYEAPELTLGDYNASLGKTGTVDAYLAEARKQARGHYLEEYTAKAAMDFIRKGFTVVP
jgi:hypothetical protein